MRPPGHHSFAGGISKDDEFDGGNQVGEGYCYFNNVAFAAMLAHKHFAKKSILIIDWDYHHGNGTQNIFFEANQKEIKAKFKDFDIYFISLHNASIYPYYNEIPNSDPTNFGTISGKAHNSNSFIDNIHFKRQEFTDEIYLPKFYQSIDKAFENIRPDLVLVSAGFDARENDPIARFEKGEGLSDKAYYQMSKYLKSKLTETNNACPIISLLEGGYNVSELGFSEALLEHLKGISES
jgi:acetoin utilization deacetylase AcuC-like enzyme